jgi:hypothetical protein
MKTQSEEKTDSTQNIATSNIKSESENSVTRQEHIIYSPEMDISYSNLFFDIRSAMDL